MIEHTCPLCSREASEDQAWYETTWQEMESDEQIQVRVHAWCVWQVVRDTLYDREGESLSPQWIGWEPRPFSAPWEEAEVTVLG